MIKFLKHDEIDFVKYDEVLKKSSYRTIFATSEWLSEFIPEWRLLIKDDYEAVMPLPIRKKNGFYYIFNPLFFPPLGIFSKQKIDKSLFDDFISAIPNKYISADFVLNPTNIVEKIPVRTYYELFLNSNYENLYANYSTNTKRNVVKSKNNGLVISKNINIEDIIKLFLNNRGKKTEHHFTSKEYDFLKKIAAFAKSKNILKSYGIYSGNNNLIAGAIFIEDFTKTLFLFSGRDESFKKERPLFCIIDEFIKQNCNKNIFLDFFGSTNKNIANFYKGFGATSYFFPFFSYYPNKILKPVLVLYKKIKKKIY